MSEGQKLLIEAAKKKGRAAIGRAIGKTRMTIHSLMVGQYEPSLETALALEQVLGIPVEAWGKKNGKRK